MHDFDSLQRDERRHCERNDCAVKAVAIVTDQPYHDVHKVMANLGRQHGKGTSFNITRAALEHFGFTVKPYWDAYQDLEHAKHVMHDRYNYKVKNMTVRHAKKFPDAFAHLGDRALVRTRRHIIGMRNGEAIDWTADGARRIMDMYAVIKKEDAE